MKPKKLLAFIGIAIVVFLAGVMTLILFPQPLFSHSYEYENFKVYSNFEVNQQAFNQALDEAHQIVRQSELYDSTYAYDLFLAHNGTYNKIDNLVLGKWPVARAIVNNVIIKRQVHIRDKIVENGPNQFDLVYVLVHEMIHCLQSHQYGIWKFNPMRHPPYWKLEGYPEYMGRRRLLENPNYDLRKGIDDFITRTSTNKDTHQIIQIAAKESTPYIYYKGRLMVEYLMDIKGFSYDNILQDSIIEGAVYEEMMEWYAEE